MLYRFCPLFLAAASFLMGPNAFADEAPAWEIGSPAPAPPPPAPVIPGPTTFVMAENSQLPEGKTRMTSPVMFGVGAVLGGLGLISFVTGYALYKDAPECNQCPGSEKQSLGTGFMIGGGAGFLIGLPLAFIGARQVPDSPSWARAIPNVYLSPQSGVLHWTF